MPPVFVEVAAEVFSPEPRTQRCVINLNSRNALEIQRKVKGLESPVRVNSIDVARIRIAEKCVVHAIDDSIVVQICIFEVARHSIRLNYFASAGNVTVDVFLALENSYNIKSVKLSDGLSYNGTGICSAPRSSDRLIDGVSTGRNLEHFVLVNSEICADRIGEVIVGLILPGYKELKSGISESSLISNNRASACSQRTKDRNVKDRILCVFDVIIDLKV